MKYLKITYIIMNDETKTYKQIVSFLNVKHIIEICVGEDGNLHIGIHGNSVGQCVDKSKYSGFRMQTNSGAIYRFLRQAGFKVKRSYF